MAGCPFCSRNLWLKPGGSAFLFSQILLHLRSCVSTPADVPQSELIQVSLDLADAAFAELYSQSPPEE